MFSLKWEVSNELLHIQWLKQTLLTEPKRPVLNIFIVNVYSYTPTKQCATHHLCVRMGEQTLIWQYVCCERVWPVALNIPDVQYRVGVSWAEPQRFIYSHHPPSCLPPPQDAPIRKLRTHRERSQTQTS